MKKVLISLPTAFLFLIIFSLFIFNMEPSFQTKRVEAADYVCNEFVKVCGKKLCLCDREFFVKGANYSGGLFYNEFDIQKDGVEEYNRWLPFSKFNEGNIDRELKFIKYSLGVNTIRLITPDLDGFNKKNETYGWEKWADSDGNITDTYLQNIKKIIKLVENNDMKVHLVLLNGFEDVVQKEEDSDLIPKPNSEEEKRYFNYLDSLIPNLVNEKAILAYEIGNEFILRGAINWSENTPYEENILTFIDRLIQKTRSLDTNHLITSSEIIAAGKETLWHYPTAEFGVINGKRLYDMVDYLSPHFYQEKEKTHLIGEVVNRSSKPVVLGEFGFRPDDMMEIKKESKSVYAERQENYFEEIIKAAEKYELSGLIAWDPTPVLYLGNGFIHGDNYPDFPYPAYFDIVFDDGREVHGIMGMFYWLYYENMRRTPAGNMFRNSFIQTDYLSGDFNGDGIDDSLSVYKKENWYWDVLVQGRGTWETWLQGWGAGNLMKTGDFDGDTRDEVLLITQNKAGWRWYMFETINNQRFSKGKLVLSNWGIGGGLSVFDIDLDGADDVLIYTQKQDFCFRFNMDTSTFLKFDCPTMERAL